jgi:hypothetical protein
MNNELICYQKFNTTAEAEVFIEVLQKNNILFKIVHNPPLMDKILIGEYYEPPVELHITPYEFERVDKLLLSDLKINLNEADKDYYLLSFSNQELIEVIQKPDEWSKYDYLLAKAILEKQNLKISDEQIQLFNKERLYELSIPEKEGRYRIFFGYVFSILGGFIGVMIGYALWNSRKVLPNGRKMYVYNENSRYHGKAIFFIGLTLSLINIILQLFKAF